LGARTKLNAAHFNGCLFVSAVVGLVAQSWLLFLLALAVTVACSVHSGGIRNRQVDGHRPQGGRTRRGR